MMDMTGRTDMSGEVRRVELLVMSGAMEQAKQEAMRVRAAIAKAEENGLTTPSEALRLALRLQAAMQRATRVHKPGNRRTDHATSA